MRPFRAEPVLRLVDIHFAHPGRRVFAGWNGEFLPGLTWVRGANGSGKSTLLKLIAGALEPLSGSRRIGATDAQQQPLAYRREVAWCGPGAPAFDHLSPADHAAFLRGLYPQFDDDALGRHMAAFGLEPVQDRRLRTLSTGTQRKAGLAATLAAGTALVVLDEPFNALDATSASHLRSVLAEACGSASRCWIVASHEPPAADDMPCTVLDLDAPDGDGDGA